MPDVAQEIINSEGFGSSGADAGPPGTIGEAHLPAGDIRHHPPPRHAHRTFHERGLREEVFDVTIKKEGTESAPESHSVSFNPGDVVEAELIIPDGPCGTTGVRIVSGDGPVWPITKGAWFRGNNERIRRGVKGWPTSGRLSLEGYNTDKFDHTFSVRFAVRELRRERPFTQPEEESLTVAPPETPAEAAQGISELAAGSSPETSAGAAAEPVEATFSEATPAAAPETPAEAPPRTPPEPAAFLPTTTYQVTVQQTPIEPATAQAPAPDSVPGHPELKPGIAILVNIVRRRWPLLSVSRTTGGVFPIGSLHHYGQAADLAGPDEAYTQHAAQWVKDNLRRYLTQGLHGPSLAVSNSSDVANSYWDQQTWSEHDGLLHLAVADAQEQQLLADNRPTVRHSTVMAAVPAPRRAAYAPGA